MTYPVFGGGNSSGPVFPVQRSVRLRSSASAYFNRTLASSGTTATFSAWVKRGSLGSASTIFGTTDASTYDFQLTFTASNTIEFYSFRASAAQLDLITTQVFRDPSAWYHIVVVLNTTNATAANRAQIYVNGVQVTAFTTATYPSQNAVTPLADSRTFGIGDRGNVNNNFFDGYLTEINFIDGQALTPTSFGAYNATTGVWQPIKYSGTYGTNGFYLNFQDNSAATAAAIGKDSSGNGNNWTPNNISVTAGVTYDSMTDVPTLTSNTNANYPVLSPLTGYGANIGSGNLQVTGSSSGDQHAATMALPTTGKWYCEMSSTAYQASTIVGWFGVGNQAGTNFSGLLSRVTGAGAGFFQNDTLISSTNIGALNTIFGLAVDRGANTITIYLNNVAQATVPTLATGIDLFFIYGTYTSGTGWVNFGQQPFTYTPPTGFLALNTYNLPTPTIPNGALYMAATTYTGNGTSQSILNSANTTTGVSFQPDLVWIKGRSGATNNGLQDSVRGTAGGILISNSTAAESAGGAYVSSLNSNGFTVNANTSGNGSGSTYVGWQWKASNAAAVSNTSGSITSQVSANPSAGFSIVTYTGTGANATVGHGLGVAPKFIIIKNRSAAWSWITGNSNYTSWAFAQNLNSTVAQTSSPTAFNSTAPTSSVFSIGTAVEVNASGNAMVAYCFAEIAGYSKFGSYTGNGSADGPFVYLGFRPRYVLIKRTDTAGGSWNIRDTSRDTYNTATAGLFANLSNAESTQAAIDILSNGFKMRDAGGVETNASGGTYIYAAFAENPFKNSLAR
jgi:hypothetical protein